MSASAHTCVNCRVKLTVAGVRHSAATGVTTRTRRCPKCGTDYRTVEQVVSMRAAPVAIAAAAGR